MSFAITAVMAGISAYQISEQNKAAQSQAEAAVAETNMRYRAEEQQQQEIQQEAGLEMANRQREALRQQSSIRARSAESGVAGASPLRELANVYMQQGIDTGSIVSKEEAMLRSSGVKSQNAYVAGASAVNQAKDAMASPLEAALQIGLSAAGGYMAGGGTFGAATAGEAAAASSAAVPSAGVVSGAGYGSTAATNAGFFNTTGIGGYGSTQLGQTLLTSSSFQTR